MVWRTVVKIKKYKDDINMEAFDIAGLLKKKILEKGADDVIISINDNHSSQIKFSNNKINVTTNWESVNLGIFLSLKKKIAVTSVRDFEIKDIGKYADNLVRFAKTLQPNEEYQGIAEGPFKYKEIEEGYDKKISSLDEKSIDYVRKGINKALELGVKRTAGIFQISTDNSFILTSNNVEAAEKSTHSYFSLRALMEKDASGHMVAVSRILDKLDIEGAAETAVLTAKESMNPKEGNSGKFDIVFSQLAFANILDSLSRAFSIFSVESGLSCLENKLNKKIASNNVNLYDDGTLKNGFNSMKFDDEGVPSQKNVLIKEGILKTYLHNTSTAKRYNTRTTSSAGLIDPEPSNIVLEKGDFKKEEIISSVKKGILITNLWYTRFQNYNTGEFSTIPRDGAFYIENGKIKCPLKNIRISDNILNIMGNIEKIGNNPVQIKGWEVDINIVTPYALVKDLNISKPLE